MDAESSDALFRGLGIPVWTLATGDWGTGKGTAAIRCRLSARVPFRGGVHYRFARTMADEVWSYLEQSGRHIFGRPPEPPNLLRLVDWHLAGGSGDADGESRTLLLDLQPTWFWSMLGTNGAMTRAQHRFPSWGIGASEAQDPTRCRTSLLANPLTVNIAAITSDTPPLVLIQFRGKAVRGAGEHFQISAAGFVDATDRASRQPVPFAAAWRELQEETSLTPQIAEGIGAVRFTALCRSSGYYLPSLCGVVSLGRSSSDLQPQTSKEAEEVDGYEWWAFTPEAVCDRVASEGGWARVNTIGAAALAGALGQEYGVARVLNAWQDAQKRADRP